MKEIFTYFFFHSSTILGITESDQKNAAINNKVFLTYNYLLIINLPKKL